MTLNILLYIGSILIIVWGIGHIVPTKNVVNGFGDLSEDNRRIITMEWIAEGLTLIFIGMLALFITYFGGSGDQLSVYIYGLSASMLLALAVLSAFTGARTSILPMKMCPFVKTSVAVLFVLGILL